MKSNISKFFENFDGKLDRRTNSGEIVDRLSLRYMAAIDIAQAALDAVYASGANTPSGFDACDYTLGFCRDFVAGGLSTGHSFAGPSPRTEVLQKLRDRLLDITYGNKDDSDIPVVCAKAVLTIANSVESLYAVQDYQSRVRHRTNQQMQKTPNLLWTSVMMSSFILSHYYGDGNSGVGYNMICSIAEKYMR